MREEEPYKPVGEGASVEATRGETTDKEMEGDSEAKKPLFKDTPWRREEHLFFR